ncbi:hypothetical protein SAMN05192549_12067 [Duganella sacchari]|uniref:Uncharacterized protein n=1 Tax=Duganella sacchari TaxID=551987 RepID=A0A1M7RCY5_9BURK|nr:hypothetical protein SAMN05192549_12067 [Duganella sacchari]
MLGMTYNVHMLLEVSLRNPVIALLSIVLAITLPGGIDNL